MYDYNVVFLPRFCDRDAVNMEYASSSHRSYYILPIWDKKMREVIMTVVNKQASLYHIMCLRSYMQNLLL